MRIAYGLFALAILAAAPAAAQDTSASPNYGTLNLSAGFNPDPQVVSVVSGGVVDASGINSRCAGFISRAPDVRLSYTAGSLPLIISAASSDDTTLVINGPDGSWYCDDDGGVNGLNPAIRFNTPQTGRYEIWVGSYRAGTNSRASLNISEVGSQ
ncbi:MAG: peptidase S1 [Brevundimonas sp.]|nr:MAG: peptidase S1 [Brevundimonas sp.]